MQVTPEFELLVEACRSAFSGEHHPCRASAEHLDSRRFVRLARFHRVQGLVLKGIAQHGTEIAPAVRRALVEDASEIAASNLRAASVCRELQEAFQSAALPLLFIKGLTLGALAYVNPSIKSSVDIDVLIDPETLSEAASLLEKRSYRLLTPERGRNRLAQWHNVHKESVWLNDLVGVRVDLHTRLADNPLLIPQIDLSSPRQTVDIGNGIHLPTLAGDELFAYLAVHGASSAWFRLKWIADFAALLGGRSAAEVARQWQRSQELGAGRAAGQALLLADELFGSLKELGELKQLLLKDRATRRLYRAALSQLAGRGEPVEPTSRRLGTAAIHWTQLLLLPGIPFKTYEFARQIRSTLN